MVLLKKSDVVLIVILLSSSVLFVYMLNKNTASGDIVLIKQSGKVLHEVNLIEDAVYEINAEDVGFNDIEIKNGEVKMLDSDCRDKICVKQGNIKHINETIICLPHKLSIQIIGSSPEWDAISQ